MIHVGVDLHQAFCYMTALDSTGRSLKAGPVANEPRALRRWLRGFSEPVAVAVKACSFWPAFKDAVEKEVERIHLVHPQRVKAIAAAKLKNDRVDSHTLAHLLRCDLLPAAWMADRATREIASTGALADFAGAASGVVQEPSACHFASARAAAAGERCVREERAGVDEKGGVAGGGARESGHLRRADRRSERAHSSAGPRDRGAGPRGSASAVAGDDSGNREVLGDDPAGGDRGDSTVSHGQSAV